MVYEKLKDGEIITDDCGCILRVFDTSVKMSNGNFGGTVFDPCAIHCVENDE